MHRKPGQRDYGTSDCAALRSLASRGVPVASGPRPARPAGKESREPERSQQRRMARPA